MYFIVHVLNMYFPQFTNTLFIVIYPFGQWKYAKIIYKYGEIIYKYGEIIDLIIN
jgi:hypothetical protein